MQYTQTWAWVHDCIVQFFPGVLFDQLCQGNVFEKQSFALIMQKSKQTPVKH